MVEIFIHVVREEVVIIRVWVDIIVMFVTALWFLHHS